MADNMKINRIIYESRNVKYICEFNNDKKELNVCINDIKDLYEYDKFAIDYFEKEFKLRGTN